MLEVAKLINRIDSEYRSEYKMPVLDSFDWCFLAQDNRLTRSKRALHFACASFLSLLLAALSVMVYAERWHGRQLFES